MTKRYTLLAHTDYPDLPADVVAAADYDALAARAGDLEKRLESQRAYDPANEVCSLSVAEAYQQRAHKAEARLAEYENVVIPSWKREEEMWRQDEARLAEAEAALREICAVDKAAPGRKDCHIWADMLEIAVDYFPDRKWRITYSAPAYSLEEAGPDQLSASGVCRASPDSALKFGELAQQVRLTADSAPAVNPHCLNDGVPCASDGAGGCTACDRTFSAGDEAAGGLCG